MPRKVLSPLDLLPPENFSTPSQAVDAQVQAFRSALATLADAEVLDPASETTLVNLWRLVARNWEAFSTSQSPLSTWSMLLKTTETLLKVRGLAQRTASGDQAREVLQSWLNEVRLEAMGEPPLAAQDDEDEGEDDD